MVPINDQKHGQSDLSQSIRSQAGRTPMVGRERELSMLEIERDVMLRGEARVVLLRGEAGIGKSRLLRAACDQLSAAGGRVLVGHCVDEQGLPPFLPWIDAFSTYSPEDDTFLALRDRLLGIAEGEPERAFWVSPEQRKGRVFATISDVLSKQSQWQPLTLGLDDLQWSDTSSNELLRYVIIHGTATRLMIIGTYRADEALANPSLQSTIEELHRRRLLTTIHLGPLNATDIGKQIQMLTGRSDASFRGAPCSLRRESVLRRRGAAANGRRRSVVHSECPRSLPVEPSGTG